MYIRRLLSNCRFFSQSKKKNNYFSQLEIKQLLAQPNQLRNLLIQQLRVKGQMKVSQYWKRALTDPVYGYYRHQNVFSKQGDFITSPEISTLFGQMVATWLVVLLQNQSINHVNPLTNNVEKRFRIVELGGGRGMLMQDILKCFFDFKITNYFDLNFIEISEFNRRQQQNRVMQQFKKHKYYFKFDYENGSNEKQQFISQNQFNDIKLSWFTKLEQLLKQDIQNKKKGKQIPFTIFIMNQFFDALPVNILQYTSNGWKQKVIKLISNHQFPFILQNSQHPLHQKLIPSNSTPNIGDKIQISPQSYLAIDAMSKIIRYCGGAILNIDYGGNGPFVDSIRAIKSHKFIPAPYFWQLPGVCDLSAHVAFSALANYAQKTQGIKAFELIPQQFFLQSLGIAARVQNLCKTAPKEKIQRLKGQYDRLVSPQQMGTNFQVQIISLKQYGEIYPHITLNSNVF